MKKKSRGRILNWVRLFSIFGILCFSIDPAAEAQEPGTAEGRINKSAFRIDRFKEKYSPLPSNVEGVLREKIDEVLAVIRLAPAAWFQTTFRTPTSSITRRKIISGFSEIEFWKCQGESCSGCTGDAGTGCVLGRSAAGGTGVVILIHPCLYGEGKCPKGSTSDLGIWIERVTAGVAYYKLGLQKNMTLIRKTEKASHHWLSDTTRTVNQLLGACPGPYLAEGLKFLFTIGSVTLPNPAFAKCGLAYIEELRALPVKCPALVATEKIEWLDFQKKQLRGTPEILRCNAYCMKMLCRKKRTGAVFTRFSDKPVLFIGDGACDGKSPTNTGRFIRDALPSGLGKKLNALNCFPDLGTETDDGGGGIGGLEDGPGVLLVE